MNAITPEEAQRQIAEAEVRKVGARVDAPAQARIAVGVGISLAVFLGVYRACAHGNSTLSHVAFVMVVFAYAVVVGVLIAWKKENVRVADRESRRRYLGAKAVTLFLYAAGFVGVLMMNIPWIIMVPYCIAVATPLSIAALRSVRG